MTGRKMCEMRNDVGRGKLKTSENLIRSSINRATAENQRTVKFFFLDRSNFLHPRTLKNWTDLELVRGVTLKKEVSSVQFIISKHLKIGPTTCSSTGAPNEISKLAWQG
jgi:hypothetical protein